MTLLIAIASSAVLLAVRFVIASSVERHFEPQDIAVLTGKMELARHTLEQLRSQDDLECIAQLLDKSLVTHHGLEVIVLGADRDVLFATPNADFSVDVVAADATRNPNGPVIWKLGEQTYRAIAAELPTGAGARSNVIVAAATDIVHHQASVRTFLQTLCIFVVGAAALTGFLGWAAARRGLAPLRAMRELAQVVTAQQLNPRLSVKSAPLELAELAQSLNVMLARLEEAIRRLSDFSSDIAHELRTPVTNLMTQTQVVLSGQRGADEYLSIFESNAGEFEYTGQMISDMLLLAKAKNGLVVPTRETVNLAAEALAPFEYYDPVAEEKRLRLTLDGDAEANAARLILRESWATCCRMQDDIRLRTRRYASPSAKARTSFQSAWKTRGDTIPPDYLERVFNRIFRVDPSRQRNSEGAGLGLAITKSIVFAHGGTVSVASVDGVTTFTIRLPRAPGIDNAGVARS